MNAHRIALGLAVLTTVGVACKRGAKQGEEQSAPNGVASGALSPSEMPADHLAPGELAEGSNRALGVVLPRDVQVKRAFPDVVYAYGPVTVHSLVRYFAAHLDGGDLREGAEAATFEHVRVHGKLDGELLVHIVSVLGGANVEIHTVVRPPAPNLPNEAARWRQVGLTPDGKLVDPTHLD